jgi:hypothetical protein
MMDTRIFDVNGKTKDQLKLAVQLLLLDEYGDKQKVSGWYFTKEKGFILTWVIGETSRHNPTPFTNRMGQPEDIKEDELTDLLWEWLSSDQAKEVEQDGWDKDLDDSDVSTSDGWRLYTEEWGHVKESEYTIDHYSLAAFKKVYLWYGK